MASILVVDDDYDILNLVRRLVAPLKHDVICASSAEEAIGILQSTPVDVVLTDANMPHHNGFDFVATLKKHSLWQEIPIAMLTGRTERQDVERAISLGAVDYIVKPIEPRLLLEKVAALVARGRAGKVGTFGLAETSLVAQTQIELTVLSVSEVGLVLLSSVPFVHGQMIKLNDSLFATFGIKPHQLKVLSCERQPTDGFVTRTRFLAMDESSRQKLRAWIFQSQTHRPPHPARSA